jgi:hypothetical protein
LDEVEAKAWREVIAALPAHWVDPAGQLILRRLAAQSAVALRLEERLRQLRAQEQDYDKEAGMLAAEHAAAGKAISELLGQLRATPKSRTVPRAAGPRVLQAPGEWRPWEIRSGEAKPEEEPH